MRRRLWHLAGSPFGWPTTPRARSWCPDLATQRRSHRSPQRLAKRGRRQRRRHLIRLRRSSGATQGTATSGSRWMVRRGSQQTRATLRRSRRHHLRSSPSLEPMPMPRLAPLPLPRMRLIRTTMRMTGRLRRLASCPSRIAPEGMQGRGSEGAPRTRTREAALIQLSSLRRHLLLHQILPARCAASPRTGERSGSSCWRGWRGA
mmetsp:Transcript_7971/g.16722  ORF Transcript_7971/g.16722 Transcript_7971/m.16722 type:complete len:204 (-) Transcript_7971:576-1187(-)